MTRSLAIPDQKPKKPLVVLFWYCKGLFVVCGKAVYAAMGIFYRSDRRKLAWDFQP
jgi:hypothetical protein